jgi:predicted N-acyltransferase
MASQDVIAKIVPTINAIDRAAWNGCANPATHAGTGVGPADFGSDQERFNPFISHDFLGALENSGCVGGRTGWTPAHLVIEDRCGSLLGATPAYLKSHSMGEYVFDHGWAEAFERAGGQYYPKLQVSVPFTPVTGRRLLIAPGPQSETARQALIAALKLVLTQTGASSVHVTFPEKGECDALAEAGFLRRTGQQFHFLNAGYGHFDDFLASLASRKRKMIRRERKEAVAAGISIERLTGEAIHAAHWDAFFAFYMDTGSRKWGRPYLTRRFFKEIGARMAEHILLVMAKRDGRFIAGAINFIGQDALYGRNWGAVEEHPFLHFEVCYYQAIEFAIEKGLRRVEAGAQGEHKLARGYRPVTTFSAHEFADHRLKRAISDYLREERLHVEEAVDYYAEHLPFRRNTSAVE